MVIRTVHYYQTPVSPEFAKHMIEETGLSERDQKIAWTLRRKTGDTQYYADVLQMPVRQFNDAAAHVHMRMIDELIRLAQIGRQAERNE